MAEGGRVCRTGLVDPGMERGTPLVLVGSIDMLKTCCWSYSESFLPIIFNKDGLVRKTYDFVRVNKTETSCQHDPPCQGFSL